MAHKRELCGSHYSLRDRLRLFGATITSSVLYGSSTWAMTAERERKLRTTQRKMLIGLTLTHFELTHFE